MDNACTMDKPYQDVSLGYILSKMVFLWNKNGYTLLIIFNTVKSGKCMYNLL